MDFINKNRILIAAAAAGAAFMGIGLAIFLNRLDKGKEPVPLPEVYEVDIASLKNGFSSRIEDIRARLAGAGVPDEELRSIAQEIAAYVEQRTREVEREDYFKAKESRERNRFSIYVEMILLWQKEKETQAKEFAKEQDDMLQSFRLSPTQIEQVNLYTQAILRDRVIKAVDANVIGEAKALLTLKTEYLKTHGENLLGDIVDICDSWEQENLTYLANILNVIINEVVYSQHQDLLDHLLEISWAIESQPEKLDAELAAFDDAISPLYERIMSKLVEE